MATETKTLKTAKRAPKAVRKPAAKKAAPKASKKPTEGTFAVFATGGKQYLVSPGQSLKIEKLQGDHKEGEVLTFDSVLVSGTGTDATIGTPFIKGSAISATLKKIGRHKTIKYKQKSRYFKKNGHRQPYFEIVIDSIK